MIPETEQWKTNGDCNKCRRAEYCNKECTARKQASERALRNFAHTVINATAPTQSIAEETKKWLKGGLI